MGEETETEVESVGPRVGGSWANGSGGRGYWTKGRQFLFTATGLCLGSANVWRFPWMLSMHGGIFIFVYVFLVFAVGMPLFILEAGLGQFASSAPLRTYRNMMPAMEGLGIASLALNALSALSQGSILAMCVFYTLVSFEAPYKSCLRYQNEYWNYVVRSNSRTCYSPAEADACVRGKPHRFLYAKGQCYDNDNASLLLMSLSKCLLSYPNATRWYSYPHAQDTWHCAFRLKLFFNVSRQDQLLVMDRPSLLLYQTQSHVFCPTAICRWRKERGIGPSLDSSDQIQSLHIAQHHVPCNHSFVDAHSTTQDHLPRVLHKEFFYVDLTHSAVSAPQSRLLQARADCIAYFLSHSLFNYRCQRIVSKKSAVFPSLMEEWQLECALKEYCKRTWPRETLSWVTCLRRTLDTHESYSADEYLLMYFGKRLERHYPMWMYQTVLCLILGWVMVGQVLVRGPLYLARLCYVTVTTAFVFLFLANSIPLFLSGGRTDHGQYLGFVWDPKSSLCQLRQPALWSDALSQVFASLNIGIGSLMTLSSYNRFGHDVVYDAFVLVSGSTIFSIFVSLSLVGVTKHLAILVSTEFPKTLSTRSGLLFFALSQASSHITCGKILGMGCFAMVGMMVLDSTVIQVGALIRALYDEWVKLRNRATLVTTLVVTAAFLGSFITASMTGLHFLEILDEALWDLGVPVFILIQLTSMAFLYGPCNLLYDFRLMFRPLPGQRPYAFFFFSGEKLMKGWSGYYLMICWTVVGPAGALFMITSFCYRMSRKLLNEEARLEAEKRALKGALGLELVVVLGLVLGSVVGTMVWRRCRKDEWRGWSPDPVWGPREEINRLGRYAFPPFQARKERAEELMELYEEAEHADYVPDPNAPSSRHHYLPYSPHHS